jgi:hypothetical protein
MAATWNLYLAFDLVVATGGLTVGATNAEFGMVIQDTIYK